MIRKRPVASRTTRIRDLLVTLWGIAFITAICAAPARAEIVNIWAVDDGTKVKADALSHPLEKSNGIFDGSKITLFGARNETVAFQVILEGGASVTAKVSAHLDRIGEIGNQSVTNNPDTYFVGRHIELFRQHYVDVRARSKGLVWGSATNGPEVPPDLDGPVPDALIPLNVIGDQVEVPAGRNQGLWVDIYIPKTAQPGVHTGTVTIAVNGTPCSLATCQIPVELTVVRATLPDAPVVGTMLFFSGSDNSTVIKRYFDNPGQVGRADYEAIAARHFKLARRHQITLFMGDEKTPDDPLAQRVGGGAFSAASGYYGPGVGLGQDMYSIHTYGGSLTATEAQTWSNWFGTNAPTADYFLYVWDEPSKANYAKINDIARAADPVPSFVTAAYTPELSEVDIFCELAEFYSAKNADAGRAAGKRIWAYNGMRPFSGTFAIDDVAISPRVNPWIQYKHDIPRWFYWESTYYYNFQGGKGDVNVFQEAQNFSNSWGDKVNGDGLLFYPGTDRVFKNEDRGHMAPFPSIRLKNWRRGIQDAAYLKMAKSAGHASVHDQALAALVPAVLADDKRYAQPVSWPDDGEQWLSWRKQLALLFVDEDAPVVSGGNDPIIPGGGGSSGGGSGGGTVVVGGDDPGTGGDTAGGSNSGVGAGGDSGGSGTNTVADDADRFADATTNPRSRFRTDPNAPEVSALTGGCALAARGTASPTPSYWLVALLGLALRRARRPKTRARR